MEETKIWSIDGNGISATRLDTTNQMETEGLLENLLTANPDMLEDGLQLVGRQTSTTGGPLDLLGVDAEGRLVVFELKRGTLNREAVAQVIDYASSLDAMDMGRLVSHVEQRSGNLGIEKIDDFAEWYSDNWQGQDLEALMPPRMVLVGLGVDDTTERMVNYMASIGMDISLLTFYGFLQEGKTLLARHVEVEVSEAIHPPWTDPNKEFERYATMLGVSDLLTAATALFEENFSYEHKWTAMKLKNTKRMNFAIGTQSYLFIRINLKEQGVLNVGFHPMAIDLALDEFNKLRFDEKGEPFSKIGAGFAKKTAQVDYAVALPLKSLEEWDTHKAQLTALTQAVSEAYQESQST
ncbi:MAG: endonuclease NucS [Chloroflexi bacterium]|nr:endonuclease NucS [Chloroflexota bacterium]